MYLFSICKSFVRCAVCSHLYKKDVFVFPVVIRSTVFKITCSTYSSNMYLHWCGVWTTYVRLVCILAYSCITLKLLEFHFIVLQKTSENTTMEMNDEPVSYTHLTLPTIA